MESSEIWIAIGVVLVLLLVLLVLLLRVFLPIGAALAIAFCAGAVAMFAWASQAGPIGFMLMLALWIFAFPVMAVLAVIIGFLAIAASA